MPRRKLYEEYEPCDFVSDLRWWGSEVNLVEIYNEMNSLPESIAVEKEMDELGHFDETLRLKLRKIENDFLQRRMKDLHELAWVAECGLDVSEKIWKDE